MKKKVKNKTSHIIFWMLVFVSFIIIAQFVVLEIREHISGEFFLIFPGLFCLLGIALIIFTIRDKIKGKLKFFLLLTGFSSAGFFVGIVLHNMFYAFAILTEKIIFLHYIMEALHVAFFFLAIPVAPIGFLIGAIASIILLVRKR